MNNALPASETPPPALVDLLQRALKHQQAGDYSLADDLYKKAVKDYAAFPDVLYMAAIFYVQMGKNKFARSLLEQFVKKRPRDFKAHRLLAKSLLKDDFEKAYEVIKAAYALNNTDVETLELYGDLCFRKALFTDARRLYYRAVGARPTAKNYNRLGHVLLLENEMDDLRKLLENAYKNQTFDYDTLVLLALAHGLGQLESYNMLVKALHFDSSRDEAKALFALSMSFGVTPIEIRSSLTDCIRFCLEGERVNHAHLASLWFKQFFYNPENVDPHALISASDYETFSSIFSQRSARTNLFTPYFIEGVKKIPLSSNLLETLLQYLRRYYLERISLGSADLEPEEVLFLCALAIQNYTNEFVISFTSEEALLVEKLQTKLNSTEAPALSDILIYACYQPLTSFENYKKLKPALEKEAAEVYHQHVGEYEIQQNLKKTIRHLSPIEDSVSKSVRQQYEENPYPRWRSENFVHPLAHELVDMKYRKPGNVLIAGCGTGKHILLVNAMRPHLHITALDLSSSSLAYAMMKCKSYGIQNVEFLQGDILELDRIAETYDEIECMGVLHHMKDPEAGLASLLRRLKPGGEISLGLYSESARQGVIAVRAVIEEQGFPATPEGIRACRDHVRAHADDPRLQLLKNSPDFFSLSGCRDLVFHVQEIRYTIPQIKAMLERNGLTFKEFIMPDVKKLHYKEAFPEDSLYQNLDHWHQFEHMYPNFFGGMYQFVAIKKA